MADNLAVVVQQSKKPLVQQGEGKVGVGDGLMEIRSMVIASMPFPPLPIMVTTEIFGETNSSGGGGTTGDSHDLIAHFLNRKAVLKNKQDNDQRCERFVFYYPLLVV